MSTKLSVNPGDLVVHYEQRYGGEAGQVEHILGVRVVNMQSEKTGNITLRKANTYDKLQTFEASGWGKGRTLGRIRLLREGETVESIQAIVKARKDEEKARKDAEARRRQTEREERDARDYAIVDSWLALPGVTRYHSLELLAGTTHLVELALPAKPITLIITFEKQDYLSWGDVEPKYSGRIMVAPEGSTCSSITVQQPDPKAMVRVYLRSWANLYELNEQVKQRVAEEMAPLSVEQE